MKKINDPQQNNLRRAYNESVPAQMWPNIARNLYYLQFLVKIFKWSRLMGDETHPRGTLISIAITYCKIASPCMTQLWEARLHVLYGLDGIEQQKM